MRTDRPYKFHNYVIRIWAVLTVILESSPYLRQLNVVARLAYEQTGRAISEAVSRWLPTAAARFRAQVW
jgi:hypothetical protein